MNLNLIDKNIFRYQAAKYILIGLFWSHFITALYWVKDLGWKNYILENHKIYCYPFFDNCFELVSENILIFKSIFVIYLAVCIISLILSYKFNSNKLYYLLLFLTLFKFLILASRYNFMGNYHTMHLSVCLIALISRFDLFYHKITLILQYFFAGTIKLNLEWASGAALVHYSPYLFPEPLYSLSIAYVPILELILVWGLISKSQEVRVLTLVQLILFHIYSILIVGLFYPLIMLGLLFPLIIKEYFIYTKKVILDEIQTEYVTSKKKYLLSICFITLICIWNISSKLINKDPSMDGEVRYFTMNMLDAKLECQHSLLEIKNDKSIHSVNLPTLASAIRTKCDPVVFETFLRRLCLKNPEKKFLFFLESKRTTDTEYTKVRNYNDVCKQI